MVLLEAFHPGLYHCRQSQTVYDHLARGPMGQAEGSAARVETCFGNENESSDGEFVEPPSSHDRWTRNIFASKRLTSQPTTPEVTLLLVRWKGALLESRDSERSSTRVSAIGHGADNGAWLMFRLFVSCSCFVRKFAFGSLCGRIYHLSPAVSLYRSGSLGVERVQGRHRRLS